jgi:hypothetical protein
VVGRESTSDELLPIKKFGISGDAGIGIDIGLVGKTIVISPELRFSAGLTDMNDESSATIYNQAISSLKDLLVSLNVHFRFR